MTKLAASMDLYAIQNVSSDNNCFQFRLNSLPPMHPNNIVQYKYLKGDNIYT